MYIEKYRSDNTTLAMAHLTTKMAVFKCGAGVDGSNTVAPCTEWYSVNCHKRRL